MQFIPKKYKHKKIQKGKLKNKIFGYNSFNIVMSKEIRLVSAESGKLTSKQLLALKQTVNKTIKKQGRVTVCIFPNISKTKKPLEVRMGKGKGNLDSWLFKITCGIVICKVETENLLLGKTALKHIQYKLPFRTKLI